MFRPLFKSCRNTCQEKEKSIIREVCIISWIFLAHFPLPSDARTKLINELLKQFASRRSQRTQPSRLCLERLDETSPDDAVVLKLGKRKTPERWIEDGWEVKKMSFGTFPRPWRQADRKWQLVALWDCKRKNPLTFVSCFSGFASDTYDTQGFWFCLPAKYELLTGWEQCGAEWYLIKFWSRRSFKRQRCPRERAPDSHFLCVSVQVKLPAPLWNFIIERWMSSSQLIKHFQKVFLFCRGSVFTFLNACEDGQKVVTFLQWDRFVQR